MRLVSSRLITVVSVLGLSACQASPSTPEPNLIDFNPSRESSATNAPPTAAPTADAPTADVPSQEPWRLTVDQLHLTDQMEPVAHPVRLAPTDESAQTDPGSEASKATDESWLDANGNRYEAMLVLEDGTAFGRKGAAPKPKTMPTAENNYGGWSGVAPTEEEIQRAIRDLEEAKSAQSVGDMATRIAKRPQSQTGIQGGSLASDRRLLVSGLFPLQNYPYNTIGALNQSTAAGADSYNRDFPVCTGTRVGPRHVLTASHCVLRDNGTWIGSGWFHPGQTNATHPNAGGTAIHWSGVYARDHRIAGSADYALLYLEDRQNSYNLGWVGMYWQNSASWYAGQVAWLHGYPKKTYPYDTGRCNASPLASKDCDGWMYSDGAVLSSTDFTLDQELTYDIDTTSGQSGNSVLWGSGSSWSTLGVLRGSPGPEGGWPTGKNRGPRMRDNMHADICDWINNVTSVWGPNPC